MKLFLLALVVTSVTTCREKIPACVAKKIEEIKSQQKWNPPAEVNEYEFEGRTVYLFSSDCCDQYNMLYDKDCNPICAPSGGITGKGDMKCPEFGEKAKHIRLVWKDDR